MTCAAWSKTKPLMRWAVFLGSLHASAGFGAAVIPKAKPQPLHDRATCKVCYTCFALFFFFCLNSFFVTFSTF